MLTVRLDSTPSFWFLHQFQHEQEIVLQSHHTSMRASCEVVWKWSENEVDNVGKTVKWRFSISFTRCSSIGFSNHLTLLQTCSNIPVYVCVCVRACCRSEHTSQNQCCQMTTWVDNDKMVRRCHFSRSVHCVYTDQCRQGQVMTLYFFESLSSKLVVCLLVYLFCWLVCVLVDRSVVVWLIDWLTSYVMVNLSQ